MELIEKIWYIYSTEYNSVIINDVDLCDMENYTHFLKLKN